VEGSTLSYGRLAIQAFISRSTSALLDSKNLATHEDLDKLVKQLEATTNATKAIEARISHETWGRQKNWEMKRDALVSVVRH
jgi:ATP phosphoribosyltransferase